MKEFTVEELLDYSRKIEQESYAFYIDAGNNINDSELKVLLHELAEEEMAHYNRINRLLENISLTEEELNVQVQITKKDYQTLIHTRSIPENPTAVKILETAFQREKNTESVYQTLISITNLSEDLVAVFTDLVNQEKGHANRISTMIRKL